ncbi:aminotransferase class V-fold PLP-dependent enzyme [Autumnicola musiva]|uniref:Aminotransferase class V-fold PLP-dependent enzyme n=1 Tax=Autumnicola musiva TaxID=3075589 RepID=A0ABU3D8U1_9FLAO|nr:aminotransferase class V-fold PLP-dependent enzyme [Zunongwangia sp. F117]MDT0677952.1 aminotransferase class V-fold PLP-dependent enzyme [Zunongwangia sp. F117]
MENLEEYFEVYRSQVIGNGQYYKTSYGDQKLCYADWTASGRLYRPIEQNISEEIGTWLSNVHSETSFTGAIMTRAYERARKVIKAHVHAGKEDVLIPCGTGMTGALARLQRILGLRIPERFRDKIAIKEEERPVVLISHMEHHSNHTSWLETICKVEVIPPDSEGLIDLVALEKLLSLYKGRELYVSVTACSNVTGIQTPYHNIAALTHQYEGKFFVDLACSAPYVEINMHPENPDEKMDAIFFSPHKFLGGPGSCGILIFNKELYKNKIPDEPGGGTVVFTDPWGNHIYKQDIEQREDGGTPGFLQTIKAALAIQLKETMTVKRIQKREEEINKLVFSMLGDIDSCNILAEEQKERLSIFSFYLEDLHYELVVQILSDRFGIQSRGGCSCAGTYGHYLMHINEDDSKRIKMDSEFGCTLNKPGWIRVSFHPTMTNNEVAYICEAIRQIDENGKDWSKDYKRTTDGFHSLLGKEEIDVKQFFILEEG